MYEIERFVHWHSNEFQRPGPMYEVSSYHLVSSEESPVESRVQSKLSELENRVEQMLLKLVSVKSKSIYGAKPPQSSSLPKDIAIKAAPSEAIFLTKLLDALIKITSSHCKVGYSVYYHSSCQDSDRSITIPTAKLTDERSAYDFLFSIVLTRQNLTSKESLLDATSAKPPVSCVTSVRPLSMNEIYGVCNLCKLIARCFAESLYLEEDGCCSLKMDKDLTEMENIGDPRTMCTYVKKRITAANFGGYFCGNMVTIVDLFVFCKLSQLNLVPQLKGVKNFDAWFANCQNYFAWVHSSHQ